MSFPPLIHTLIEIIAGSFVKKFFASDTDINTHPNEAYKNNYNNKMASQQQQQQNNGGGDGSVAPRPLQMGAKGAYIVRLLMVGDSSCGKTSLVLRFDQNVFSTKFVTTIGVDYRDKMVKVRHICTALSLCPEHL